LRRTRAFANRFTSVVNYSHCSPLESLLKLLKFKNDRQP
jgi:hypothetical protein